MPNLYNNSIAILGGGGGDNLWNELINSRIDYGSVSYLFCNYKIDSFDKYLSGFDLSSVNYFNNMFDSCSYMQSAPVFDTSGAINMSKMFYGCSALTDVPLYNTSNATNMNNMFYGCSALTTVPPFDTSKATDLSRMFYHCGKLSNISLLNTSSATNLEEMFVSCDNLTLVPLFDLSKATKISQMFSRCSNLKKIETNSWEKVISAGSANGVAEYCYSLKDFIIRNATKAPILYSSGDKYGSPFRDCYHFNGTFDGKYNVYGAKDGRIYVPDELVDTFKTATHWSYYADMIYPISEYSETDTEPYLTEIGAGKNSSYYLNKITEPYGEYTYNNPYNATQTLWTKISFHIPATANNRKLKITYRIDSSYEYSHVVKASLLDQDYTYDGTRANNSQYYSSGITATTHEIIYDNLPDGDHFINIGSYCNDTVYVKIEFIEPTGYSLTIPNAIVNDPQVLYSLDSGTTWNQFISAPLTLQNVSKIKFKNGTPNANLVIHENRDGNILTVASLPPGTTSDNVILNSDTTFTTFLVIIQG